MFKIFIELLLTWKTVYIVCANLVSFNIHISVKSLSAKPVFGCMHKNPCHIAKESFIA